MPVWIRNYIKFLIAACLIVSFCLVEGDAQTRRKKRRRSVPAAPKPVITNPTIAPPEASKNPDACRRRKDHQHRGFHQRIGRATPGLEAKSHRSRADRRGKDAADDH